MGKFNKLLDATFDPPKTWKLNSSLSFDSTVPLNDVQVKVLRAVGVRISLKGRIAVPKNFKTDLASVPRPAWAVCSPFDIARAAVIHDYIYWCNPQVQSRRSCQQIIVQGSQEDRRRCIQRRYGISSTGSTWLEDRMCLSRCESIWTLVNYPSERALAAPSYCTLSSTL